MSNEPDYTQKEKLTIKEASWLLDVSVSTIYKWIALGEIAFVDGTKKKVFKADLLAHKSASVGRPKKNCGDE